jgi:hypothetical protein
LMASELPGELIVFFLCGTFGWGATPFAFQVITRALVWELTHGTNSSGARHIWGQILMYVDDIIGISFKCNVAHDMAATKTLCEALLGPGAVADDKSDHGVTLEVIGYTISLATQRVGIARKNICRALYAAFAVQVEGHNRLKAMQRVASHASRYKTVCREMAPFARALHQAAKGHFRHASFTLSADTKRSVWMMRILLILTEMEGVTFTRSFHSFGIYHLGLVWIIEFDACLTGIGIIWIQVQPDGTEVAVGCAAIDLRHLGLDEDSSYQNCCEFMAVALGVRGLAQRGVREVGVRIRGDSMSALCWAEKEAFHSDLVGNAAMVFVAGNVRCQIEVVARDHWPAWWNWRTDFLSREGTRAELLRLDNLVGRDGREVAVWEETRDSSRLDDRMKTWKLDEGVILSLCNPSIKAGGRYILDEEEAFYDFWERVLGALPP